MGIHFQSEGIEFKLKHKQALCLWIEQVINSHHFYSGDITYIFCSDDFLLDLNQRYLKHTTLTDIISFNYSHPNIISGDIFISIERVGENAAKFNTTMEAELHRVMIHGILHFLGHNDKTPLQRKKMRLSEDQSLKMLHL